MTIVFPLVHYIIFLEYYIKNKSLKQILGYIENIILQFSDILFLGGQEACKWIQIEPLQHHIRQTHRTTAVVCPCQRVSNATTVVTEPVLAVSAAVIEGTETLCLIEKQQLRKQQHE